MPKPDVATTITTTTSGSGGSGSGSGSGSGGTTSPNGSPTEGSPPCQTSPPQQHSPTETAQPIIPSPAPGRAALRGVIHHTVTSRPDFGPGLDTLSITGSEELAPDVKPTMFESVLRTKPETCTEKKGSNGTPLEILCNYFEVVETPDW